MPDTPFIRIPDLRPWIGPVPNTAIAVIVVNGKTFYAPVSEFPGVGSLVRPISPVVNLSEGGTGEDNAPDARFSLGLSAVGINAFIEAPTNQEYVLVYRAPYPMVLDHLDVETVAGSLTLTVTVNNNPVTGLAGLAVINVNLHAVAVGANVVSQDDVIAITVAAVAAPVNLKLTLEGVR